MTTTSSASSAKPSAQSQVQTHFFCHYVLQSVERLVEPGESKNDMASMREGLLSSLYRHLTGGPCPYSVAGIVLLLAWFGWWGASLAQHVPHLLLGSPIGSSDRITYIPNLPLIGLDFQHNYAGVKTWLRGGIPYLHMTGDPMTPRYSYPPLTLWAFVWVGLFSPQSEITVTWQGPDGTLIFAFALRAIYVWMAAITGIVSFAAWQSGRARNLIGLPPLPSTFILGVALISYPAMFQLERGNCDVLPLLAVTILVCAFDIRNRLCSDLVAAVCVVFAAGIKAYPGILLLGLVALRHYRAAVFATALMILKGVTMWSMLLLWLNIIRKFIQS